MVLYIVAGVTWAFSLRLGILMPNKLLLQRRILVGVHAAFPYPVPYVDRNAIVASYPKVGFFMSSWGMRDYREAGHPIFEELLHSRAPQFLIVDSPALVLQPSDTVYTGPRTNTLLERDLKTLRDSFVHFWGPIYVAGKRFRVAEIPSRIDFSIVGTYVIETSAPVLFDGVRYVHGESVPVSLGLHTVASLAGDVDVTLRTATVVARPLGEAPRGRIYVDF
jgi:hypothetical protein